MAEPDSLRRAPALPSFIERLALRVSRWQWWLIIILVGIIFAFISFLNSNLYRRALSFVADNPQITTDRFANVAYDVRGADGRTTRISGVLLTENAETITVQTQSSEIDILQAGDYADFTCASPSSDGACPLGSQTTVRRTGISGRLIFEDMGRYQIVTEDGLTLNIRKFQVDQPKQVRQPENCPPNPEGTCQITLVMLVDEPENIITGTLIEFTEAEITLEIRPAKNEIINRADIANLVRSEPGTCALNNFAGCNEGIFMTMAITVFAFIFSVLVGLTFSLMRISGNPILTNIATIYVEAVRGVPMLVILLLVGFAVRPWLRDEFPRFANTLILVILALGLLLTVLYVIRSRPVLKAEPYTFWQGLISTWVIFAIAIGLVLFIRQNNNVSAEVGGIIGLAIGYGAFLAEVFRAGIQSVARGQSEAARSLGMTYTQSMRWVILPQAFRVVLPPLGNEFIALLKDSSLITILAINEMTQRARQFAADTLRPFPAYLTIAVLYLCMTLFLSFMVRVAEHRTSSPR
jgi:polar amino acid transport system permease protein